MPRGRTQKIGDILTNVLARRPFAGSFEIRQVQESLTGVLTEKELEHVRAGAVRKGCLTLLVNSPSLIYELEAFRSEEIVAGLRERGHGQIGRVRFEFENRGK